MANNLIAAYSLLTDHGGDYAANRYIKVFWNDSIEAIQVYVVTDLYYDTGILQTFGPSLGFEGLDYRDPTNYDYQFCDGDQLNSFTLDYLYPYVQQHAETSAICTTLPCDLYLSDPPVTTPASAGDVNDGTITLTASSGNGPIKYALFDFDYNFEGQTTGVFTDLFGALYTIYVKDALGCSFSIPVEVPVANDYGPGPKYFMEWSDIHGKSTPGYNHKIEIWERGYTGAASELQAAGAPFTKTLHSEGESIFYIIRASEIEFSFLSDVSFLYHDLFTEDDKKFLVKHFLASGAGYVQDWAGYLQPFFYSEEYNKIVYKITVSATCGLAQLKELDFTDATGNNLTGHFNAITIIAVILKKLALDLNIRSGINIYETHFATTADDDPLEQAYYDVSVYYDKDGVPAKCDTVLKNILVDYTAAISQVDLTWTIWRPEEMIGNLVYREFNTEGIFIESGTIDPVIVLDVPTSDNRLAWKDQSGIMSLLASYGTFIIRQKLIPKKSLLQSYSFEATDVVPYGNGFFFFEGWQINVLIGSGVTWGLEKVSRGDSKGAMFIKFGSSNYSLVSVKTTAARISWTSNDALQIGFDYLIDSEYKFPWVRISYKIKIGDRYYTDDRILGEPSWSSFDYGFHEIYAKEYNTFITYQKTIKDWGDVSFGDDELIEVTFLFDNRPGYDVVNISGTGSLKEVDTAYFKEGVELRRVVKYEAFISLFEYTYFTLKPGVEEDDYPNFVRPGDYSGSNQKVWSYDNYYTLDESLRIRGVVLDNVIIRLLPEGQEPQESRDFVVVKNPNNSRVFIQETFHGDYLTTKTNAAYAYKNFIKYKLPGPVYVPTSAWTRAGFAESNVIQKIMLSVVVAQYGQYSRRLTGSVMGDVYLKAYSRLDDQSDGGRNYLAQGYEQGGTLLNEYNVDLYEVKDAQENVSAFSGAFQADQYGVQFD